MPTHDDERLLELLAGAMAVSQPVPATTTEDARAVFTWRTIDAELMALGFDSAIDELVGVRSTTAAIRLLRFSAGQIEIEVDVADGGLEGFVAGAEVRRVRLERPDGSVRTADVDEVGRFDFEEVAQGPVRLHLEADGHGHVTEWFVV